MRQIAATSRLVCTAAGTRLCAYLVAAICRTNSNQFEFVRQIVATKFCRSDSYFHMSHGAICCSNLSRRRVAVICRIVCLGLKGNTSGLVYLETFGPNIGRLQSVLIFSILNHPYYLSRQMCPGLNANEIQIPYDKHHKVSSWVKVTKTHAILLNMK